MIILSWNRFKVWIDEFDLLIANLIRNSVKVVLAGI